MPVLSGVIDVLTMKSDRPVRRLVAYYVIVAIIVAILAYFFPAEIGADRRERPWGRSRGSDRIDGRALVARARS